MVGETGCPTFFQIRKRDSWRRCPLRLLSCWGCCSAFWRFPLCRPLEVIAWEVLEKPIVGGWKSPRQLWNVSRDCQPWRPWSCCCPFAKVELLQRSVSSPPILPSRAVLLAAEMLTCFQRDNCCPPTDLSSPVAASQLSAASVRQRRGNRC